MLRRVALGLLLLVAACSGTHANQPVQQSGTVTSGHLPSWVTSNVVQDGGTATAPKVNSLGLYGAGGTPFCISASATPAPYSATPYRLCAGVSSSTGGYLALTTGASPGTALPFAITIDGATVFSSATGVAPTFPLSAGQFIVGTVLGTSNAVNMTGDCLLIAGSPGSISCPSVLNNNYASPRGSVFFYGASGWTTLSPGTANQVLATGGAGADPSWVSGLSNPAASITITPGGLSLASGVTAPNGGVSTNLITSTTTSSTLTVKAGTAGTALMQIGTSSSYPIVRTLVPLELPGLAWGNTASDEAPVYQNATVSGTTTSAKAGLSAFLKATDNSICTNEDSDTGCYGLRVHTLVGAGAAGARAAAYGILDITAATLNNCTFSATGSSISGTTYSVGTVTSGTVQVGCILAGSGVTSGTVITANISGSGSGSTWTVTPSQGTGTIATAGTNNSMQYVGVFGKCNLLATDGSSGSYATCFGMNAVGHVKAGVSASQVIGAEVDTWTETTSVVQDRIGAQIVDVTGTTYGSQATRDDVALSINSQYATSSGLGYKIGIEFGRNGGGGIGVATDGTLMYAQGNGGASVTVANGIDWSKLTFTGNAINVGGLIVTGTGDIQLNSTSGLGRSATTGFMHFPYIAGLSGPPNGAPTNGAGPACVWNLNTVTLNCYSSGSWYHVTFSAGAG